MEINGFRYGFFKIFLNLYVRQIKSISFLHLKENRMLLRHGIKVIYKGAEVSDGVNLGS